MITPVGPIIQQKLIKRSTAMQIFCTHLCFSTSLRIVGEVHSIISAYVTIARLWRQIRSISLKTAHPALKKSSYKPSPEWEKRRTSVHNAVKAMMRNTMLLDMVLSSMQLQTVSVTLWFRRLQCLVLRSVLSVFINLRSAECVCSYYGLRVCS